MNATVLVLLLQVAGVLHLGLVWAGASLPRVVHLGAHLAVLPEFIRRLVWVYYAFIGFCLVGFGGISFFHAEALASGVPLARAVCGFLCGFWTVRFIVVLFAVMTGRFAGEIAAGTNEVGRWLATGIGLFWALRAVLQVTYYSGSHWRGRLGRTASHITLLLLYSGLAAVYLFAGLNTSI